ncbi:MAG: TIGR02147 family protein [Fibrobacterota bacterium]|nr:TIGR02147 family protein [Fibrobacterota bacterium]QQS06251.1 MAG: TIGR02147 family protein [Fibrobacterota bacterium]
MKPVSETPGAPSLPLVWEYTDYRAWLTDTFKARKAIHSWYSYGVLAQRAGFQARDFLLRVMRGDRRLSMEGAERLANALDLPRREKAYFLALVEYNQAKTDADREVAWGKVQHALAKSQNASAPRLLTDLHREILSEWHHLAIRSLIEMTPDPGDWEALGKRLHPPRTQAVVRKSVKLLEKGGLLDKRPDGLWHATEKAIATPPEVANPAVRQFHRECLELASASLGTIPSDSRNVTGLTIGISPRTYRLVCDRLTELREEIARLSDSDEEADRVYQLTLALFPLSTPDTKEQP